MKAKTAQQLINAIAANKGERVWKVIGGWSIGATNRTMASNVTYREACAHARAIRDAFGYASVERV